MSSNVCFLTFDATYHEAISWAETRAARLVTEMTAESRAAIRSVVKRIFAENITVANGAKLIKNIVGLTGAQANAVVNLHQKILQNPGAKILAGRTPIRVPQAGMSAQRLETVLERYADKLHRSRAMNIARTETIAAANEGQSLLWKQAIDRGDLPKNVKHEWIASMSERTCPVCSGMNGEIVVVGTPFSAGMTNPPAHPMCRCTTGLVAA